MKFSLIICTYERPGSLIKLLSSIKNQTVYPNQIIIVDGSKSSETESILKDQKLHNLFYYKVGTQDRGLTRQRNFGISKVAKESEIVHFLDDDTFLDYNYFREINSCYKIFPLALGVSGAIINEIKWWEIGENSTRKDAGFIYDGWGRNEGSRFKLRKKFGLAPDVPPGFMPSFSHGYSAAYLPPSGKIYEVEMLMGGIASYKKEVFDQLKFSEFFEGYGLYEDADFSLRVSKLGQLYVNTSAKVEHYHHQSGRPNKIAYGRMVVRNGWYVWRVKNPQPSFESIFKWHSTSFLLTLIRFSNVINTQHRKEALEEGLGRIIGWVSLFFKKPNVQQ